MVLVCSGWWVQEHSKVKVAKLQYKTAGCVPCLFWLGAQEHSLVKVAKLQYKTAGHGLCFFQWGVQEHSLAKVAKLQYKSTGHGPCLFWWGVLEHSLVKVAKFQCKSPGHGHCLFLLGGRGVGIRVKFWTKTVFSAQKTSYQMSNDSKYTASLYTIVKCYLHAITSVTNSSNEVT